MNNLAVPTSIKINNYFSQGGIESSESLKHYS